MAESRKIPTLNSCFDCLKRTAAILFFAILLFNWFGYRLVIDYVQQQHTRELQAQFDENEYDDSQLISVKTHYPLPYLVNSAGFERWDGEVDIDGILYKYVKRRFVNDSIEFLCVPDHKTMQLQTARDNFFRLANDLQQNRQPDNTTLPAFKNLLNDFCEEIKGFDFAVAQQNLLHYSYYPTYHTGYYANNPGQPPDSRYFL